MHLSIIIEYHPIFLRKIQEVMPSRDSTKYTVALEIVVPYYAEPSEVMTLNFFTRDPQVLISINTCYTVPFRIFYGP
jgi:hypothetical protein